MSSVSPIRKRYRGSMIPEPLYRWISDWGEMVFDAMTTVGDMAVFAGRMFWWLFTAWPRRGTILPNFYYVGVLSLPVVALTGTFIGMVLAVQSYAQFHNIGLESRLGAVINMSLVRELGAGARRHHAGGSGSAAQWPQSWAQCELPNKLMH